MQAQNSPTSFPIFVLLVVRIPDYFVHVELLPPPLSPAAFGTILDTNEWKAKTVSQVALISCCTFTPSFCKQLNPHFREGGALGEEGKA